ncbi:hypothetical protein BGZ58_002309 [Dissophora ornata]|nr:hypothetical protein BGZ58_002309 [Dissophora ornata]
MPKHSLPMTNEPANKCALSPLSWRAAIKKDKPGADYFLSTVPARFDQLEYFKSRNATSDKRELLTFEWVSWMNEFSKSDIKPLRDTKIRLRPYRKWTLARFWKDLVHQEEHQRQKQQLMER